MKNLLKKLWAWVKPKLVSLFTLTCKTIGSEVLGLLNNAELQQQALACVKAAAEDGLKGNDAFDAAFDALTDVLKAEGQTIADNVKDTLIQNAYCVWKNSPSSEEDGE